MQITMALLLPRDELTIPVARRLLRDALRTLGADLDGIGDIEVALSEACTNVLGHAVDGDQYEVRAVVADDEVAIEVVDRGGGFDALDLGHGDAREEAETGRGIQLMRRLVDRIQFENRAVGGTVVHMTKVMKWRDGSPALRLRHPSD